MRKITWVILSMISLFGSDVTSRTYAAVRTNVTVITENYKLNAEVVSPKANFYSSDLVNDFQNKDFSISPNPAKTRLNIILPSHMNNAKVAVFDVLGKQVYSGEISNLNSSINVSNWNSGVYLVKVTANDVTQTKRFIKE